MSGLWSIEPEWLFDGSANHIGAGQAVLIRGQTIEDIGPAARLRGSAVERIVPLPGITLLPGLIDAHAHLAMYGGATPRQILMRDSDEFLLLRAATAAREAVLSGITTVRDCGDRGGITYDLREAIRRGITPGPRLLLSGSPLTPPRGHCYFLGGEVEGEEQIRESISTQAAHGADFIKVMATGGGLTPGTDALGMQFSLAELTYIVREASRLGLGVAAHAHSPESIAACVEAGVRTIEHASFVSPGIIAADREIVLRLANAKIAVVPTCIPARSAVRAGRSLGLARQAGLNPEVFLARRQEVVADLVEAGVSVIAGTDGGATGVHITDLPGEIEMLVESGMGAAAAIRAGTSESAAALGLEGVGTIAPGCFADLLGVRGNPLENLNALGMPALVVRAGCILREERCA